jgi:hypothetical protein
MTKAELDQALAMMRDLLPRQWWAIYCGSVEVGFTDPQAFALVQTYILGQCPAGIRPDGPGGRAPNDE